MRSRWQNTRLDRLNGQDSRIARRLTLHSSLQHQLCEVVHWSRWCFAPMRRRFLQWRRLAHCRVLGAGLWWRHS
jgi:hypothetical protein